MTVEAEFCNSAVSLQFIRMELPDTIHSILREEHAYRLDLSTTPRLRNSGLCFADHWPSSRFEAPGQVFVLPPGESLRVRSGVGSQSALICHLQTGNAGLA